MLFLLLSGCFFRVDTAPESPQDDSPSGNESGTLDSDATGQVDTAEGPAIDPQLVVLLTIDSVNTRFLGRNQTKWNTTPNLDQLFAESTLIPNVLTPRGLTMVSMVSMLTGNYPRNHGVRSNVNLSGDGETYGLVWGGEPTGFLEILQQEGWYTYGLSANMCEAIDHGIDERLCTWDLFKTDIESQKMGDQILVDGLLEKLESRPLNRPLFVWMHLIDPHDPYDRIEPYYSEFHPQEYTGELSLNTPSDGPVFTTKILYNEMTEEDIEHLHAVYASQLRSNDQMIGELFDGLKALGLYDDATIIYGSDHGDELAMRTDYAFHGCSVHDTVLRTSYSIRAPGILPAGQVISGWASMTDIGPTILELMGSQYPDPRDGSSLLSVLEAGAELTDPVFFERGVDAAGIISGQYKYFLNPNGDYRSCVPFIGTEYASYASPLVELYDLDLDPNELINLSGDSPEPLTELHGKLCEWLTQSPWTSNGMDSDNVVIQECN